MTAASPFLPTNPRTQETGYVGNCVQEKAQVKDTPDEMAAIFNKSGRHRARDKR